MAAYMNCVEVFRALVPRGEKIADYPELPQNNFIDKLIFQKLRGRLFRNALRTALGQSPIRLLTIFFCSLVVWAGVYTARGRRPLPHKSSPGLCASSPKASPLTSTWV